MLEVSALSAAFSSHVAQQAAQIEALYAAAVESSANLARGNAELGAALEHSAGVRLYVAAILLGAALLLLLLDWQAG